MGRGATERAKARRRLFAELVKPRAGRLALGLACSAIVAAVGAVYAYLTGPLLQLVLTGGTQGADYFAGVLGLSITELPAGSVSVAAIVVLLTAMAALKGLFQLCQTALLGGAVQGIGHDLRVLLYGHLLGLPLRDHRHYATGDLLARLSDDSRQWQHAAVEAPLALAREGLAAFALLAVALWLSPWLTLGAVVVLPLVGGAIVWVSRRVRHAAGAGQQTLGGLLAHSERSLACIRELKLWGAEQRELKRFEGTSAELGHWGLRRVVVRAVGPLCNEVAAALALGAVVLLAVGRVHAGGMPPERLVSLLTAVLLLYRPIKGVGNAVQMISTASASADRLVELLCRPGEKRDGLGPLGSGVNAGLVGSGRAPAVRPQSERTELPELVHGISATDLQFRYSEDGPLVLNGASLQVCVGEVVVITGRSGSGKSTLLDLIAGLEPWQQGVLQWDGRRVDTHDVAARRARLALVPQQPMILDGTVAENLRYAVPGARDEALWRALHDAGLAAEVLAMEHRLDTRLGSGAASLSVGQLQRLAISRALLRGARLMLLDEPTAALDAAARGHLIRVLSDLRATLAIVVVTHCDEMADFADRVLCLQDGVLGASDAHPLSGGGMLGGELPSLVPEVSSPRRCHVDTLP